MISTEKRDHLLGAATALLAEAPNREMNIVTINKALFYLDLVALRDLGETVTQNTYIALEWGPVIAKYKQRLIRELEAGGYAVQGTTGDDLSRPLRLRRRFEDLSFIPGPLRLKLADIVRWACSQKAGGLSDISHGNPGWIASYREGLSAGKKPQPINMSLALQQLGDKDPWLESSFSPEELEEIAQSDQSRGEVF
jgi:hypothetical protein